MDLGLATIPKKNVVCRTIFTQGRKCALLLHMCSEAPESTNHFFLLYYWKYQSLINSSQILGKIFGFRCGYCRSGSNFRSFGF